MKLKDKIYYSEIEIEVLEGDYVLLKPLFFGKGKYGRVSYIPDITARELAKENKQADEWIIEFEDKTVTGWTYSPEDLQPPKRLKFIKRKDDSYVGPSSDEIEKLEETIPNE